MCRTTLKPSASTAITFKQMLQQNAQVPMRDHRMQQLIVDASRYRAAMAKASEAKRKPMPQCGRPGLPGGSARTGRLKVRFRTYRAMPSLYRSAGGVPLTIGGRRIDMSDDDSQTQFPKTVDAFTMKEVRTT